MREGNRALADSLYRRWEATGKMPPRANATIAYVRDDPELLAAFFRDAAASTGRVPFLGARDIAIYFEDFGTADSLARVALTPDKPPAVQAFGHRFLAELAVARGQREAAREHLDRSESLEPGSALELRALYATLPFLPVGREELLASRTELRAWDPGPAEPPGGLPARLRPHARLCLLGLLESRLGESESALRYGAALELLEAPEVAVPVVASLAGLVRAEAANRRGRPQEALQALEAARGQIPSDVLDLPVFSEERARFLRGELHLALGNHAEAIRWYATAFAGTPLELAYLAPAHLRLAEAHDRAGEREEAVRHYARFVELWAEADPEVRPVVEKAQKRLEELLAETPAS